MKKIFPTFFMKMISDWGFWEITKMQFLANKKECFISHNNNILSLQFSNKNCIVIYFFDCATTWCRLTDIFFENLQSDLTFNFFKPNLIVRCSIIYLSWAFSFIYQLVKSISQLHHAYHTIVCNFFRSFFIDSMIEVIIFLHLFKTFVLWAKTL